MRRTPFIFAVVAALAVVLAAACLPISKYDAVQSGMSQRANSTPIGDASWTAGMGWRYVAYIEGDISLWLSIEPMVKGEDRVYVPNEASWLKAGPSWTRERRLEVLSRLKSVKWNRKLTWQECECALSLDPYKVIPGSLESTSGGRALEDQRLFEPGSKTTHEQAHKMWQDGARMFAEQARGRVTIFATGVIPDSVFGVVELPALKKNPNVTLVFK